MRSPLRTPTLLAAIVAVLTSGRADAQPPPAAPSEAADRFDRGLARFEAGDHAAALAEFERAYALAPHPAVLLNIGLVQAKLGRPVEALAAFDRLLADGSRGLRDEQLAVARNARAEQALLVAEIAITTDVPAVIEVDGVEVARTPLALPLRVKSGTRVIGAHSPGRLPLRKAITIAGGERRSLPLTLAPATTEPARLQLSTALPDVDVLVDGRLLSRTPLVKALALEPGRRVIELRREGYAPSRRELDLAAGVTAELPFTLAPLPDARRGRLVIAAAPGELEVAVDGQPPARYQGPLALPVGAHRIHVACAGFLPASETVDIPADGERRLVLDLVPTAEARAAHVARKQDRRFWGWTTLAGGAALAAAAAGFVVHNHGVLDDARRDRRELERRFSRGGECEDFASVDFGMRCQQRAEENRQTIERRELARKLGLVAAGLGVAAALTGGYLLINPGEPSLSRAALQVDGAAGGAAATLALRF